jgi:hypothetical protein
LFNNTKPTQPKHEPFHSFTLILFHDYERLHTNMNAHPFSQGESEAGS